jgi:hypothetical protein
VRLGRWVIGHWPSDLASRAHRIPGKRIRVSIVPCFSKVGRTVPEVFDSCSPVRVDLADASPHATRSFTSTIANRSVISVANSSRYSPR